MLSPNPLFESVWREKSLGSAELVAYPLQTAVWRPLLTSPLPDLGPEPPTPGKLGPPQAETVPRSLRPGTPRVAFLPVWTGLARKIWAKPPFQKGASPRVVECCRVAQNGSS